MFSALRFSGLKKLKSIESKTMTVCFHLLQTPTLCRDSFELKAFQDWAPNIEKLFFILKVYIGGTGMAQSV